MTPVWCRIVLPRDREASAAFGVCLTRPDADPPTRKPFTSSEVLIPRVLTVILTPGITLTDLLPRKFIGVILAEAGSVRSRPTTSKTGDLAAANKGSVTNGYVDQIDPATGTVLQPRPRPVAARHT